MKASMRRLETQMNRLHSPHFGPRCSSIAKPTNIGELFLGSQTVCDLPPKTASRTTPGHHLQIGRRRGGTLLGGRRSGRTKRTPLAGRLSHRCLLRRYVRQFCGGQIVWPPETRFTDHEWLEEQRMLFIPMTFDSELLAYRVPARIR